MVLGARGNFGWVLLCQYLLAWVSLPKQVMPCATKPALALSFLPRRSLALISLSPEAEGGRSETVSCPGLCWKHLAHLVCIPRGKEMWSCSWHIQCSANSSHPWASRNKLLRLCGSLHATSCWKLSLSSLRWHMQPTRSPWTHSKDKSHLQTGQHHRHGIRLGCTWPCYQLLLQSSWQTSQGRLQEAKAPQEQDLILKLGSGLHQISEPRSS